MNARRAFLWITASLLLAHFGFAVAAPTTDGIVVTGAREVKETSVGLPQSLRTALGSIGIRFELWLVDQIRPINITPIPTALRTQLGQVSPRVIVQAPDAARKIGVVSPPGTLISLLSQVPNRIIIQHPKTYRRLQPVYPVGLFNDKTAPLISGVIVSPGSAGTVTVVWSTDEYATSEVAYGTQSGRYDHTVSDPLFVGRHEMTLRGLTSGAKYYFVVRSTDRSGNTATSAEGSFTARVVSFLPLIRRR
jgi:hypothetical protein